jgi:hypothetical protein
MKFLFAILALAASLHGQNTPFFSANIPISELGQDGADCEKQHRYERHNVELQQSAAWLRANEVRREEQRKAKSAKMKRKDAETLNKKRIAEREANDDGYIKKLKAIDDKWEKLCK